MCKNPDFSKNIGFIREKLEQIITLHLVLVYHNRAKWQNKPDKMIC